MCGHARVFVLETLRFTLESPIKKKHLNCAISSKSQIKSLMQLLASNIVRKIFQFFRLDSFSIFSFNFQFSFFVSTEIVPLEVCLLTLAETMCDSCLVVDSVKDKPV